MKSESNVFYGIMSLKQKMKKWQKMNHATDRCGNESENPGTEQGTDSGNFSAALMRL